MKVGSEKMLHGLDGWKINAQINDRTKSNRILNMVNFLMGLGLYPMQKLRSRLLQLTRILFFFLKW